MFWRGQQSQRPERIETVLETHSPEGLEEQAGGKPVARPEGNGSRSGA